MKILQRTGKNIKLNAMTKDAFILLIKEKLEDVETSDNNTVAYQLHPMWTMTTT